MEWSENDKTAAAGAFLAGYFQVIPNNVPVSVGIGAMAGRALDDIRAGVPVGTDSWYIFKTSFVAFGWSYVALMIGEQYPQLPGNPLIVSAAFGAVGAATAHRLMQ